MNQHVGRSQLDSIIDSLPDDDSTRRIVRTAVTQWGADVVRPFCHTRRRGLTSAAPTHNMQNHHTMTISHRNKTGQGSALMLSPTYLPAPLGGTWGTPANVPPVFAANVQSFAPHFRAPATLRRRYSSWKKILGLCIQSNTCPVPMAVGTAVGVIAKIADSGVSLGDVKAVRDAIAFVHKHMGYPDPTQDTQFAAVFAGIKRVLGGQPSFRKMALTRAEVGAMIAYAYRKRRPDHAVALAIAFEGALRVSELCALRISDVQCTGGRVRLYISRSKSDQHSVGAYVNLEFRQNAPFNASKILLSWLSQYKRQEGFLLSPLRAGNPMSGPLDERTFTRMVKFYAACIGIDARQVGSHSMRAGWITAEVDLGRSSIQIAAHARHASPDMLLGYYRSRRPAPNFVAYASAGNI